MVSVKWPMIGGLGNDVSQQFELINPQQPTAIEKAAQIIGRDFYDAMFFVGMTKPNFGYLKVKYKIDDMLALKAALLRRCATLDFKQLAKDVAPLVFIPGDAKKVELFTEFVRGMG